jgi:hypothetical protein
MNAIVILWYHRAMPKRSSKAPPTDPNSAAFAIVEQATADEAEILHQIEESTKDPAAVALGRKGGLKGGPARKAALTPEQRQEAAKKAAEARWRKKPSP